MTTQSGWGKALRAVGVDEALRAVGAVGAVGGGGTKCNKKPRRKPEPRAGAGGDDVQWLGEALWTKR